MNQITDEFVKDLLQLECKANELELIIQDHILHRDYRVSIIDAPRPKCHNKEGHRNALVESLRKSDVEQHNRINKVKKLYREQIRLLDAKKLIIHEKLNQQI